MKAINVLLSFVVSLAVVFLVFEGGLRLLGKRPAETIHRFDPTLGWVKRPGASARKKTPEFDVTFDVNGFGLRDDDMAGPEKREGRFRALALGDSFVLGYTVDRDDLFVDQLEKLWNAGNGPPADVINAGTEGWSTDQEALWFLENGERYQPDLVLLFPYENDLYWNGQTSYLRFPKPRFQPDGAREERGLTDPGERTWFQRSAIGSLVGGFSRPSDPAPWSPDGVHFFGGTRKEYAAYFHDQPDFMAEAVDRTRGALRALKAECARIGAALVVVPIPNKGAVDPAALEILQQQIGVAADQWTPHKPVETFLALAADLDIQTLDARPALEAAVRDEGPQYFPVDWHLNPAGNRTFAMFLDGELAARGLIPAGSAATPSGERLALLSSTTPAPSEGGFPTWLIVYLILATFFGILFGLTYPDENKILAFLKVAAFLALVFAMVLFGKQAVSPLIGLILVLAIFGFVLYKLGPRIATILELMSAFVLRGHWYLMPLVMILLTVGSLLVVAASSPLVAPFIYTLF